MAAFVQDHDLGSDFDWCADIYEHTDKPLYADIMHYIRKETGWSRTV
jgi:hypothetical protein